MASNYILSDEEVTNICASHITIEKSSEELRAVISLLELSVTDVERVVPLLAKIDVALHVLKPLVAQLYCLQKQEE